MSWKGATCRSVRTYHSGITVRLSATRRGGNKRERRWGGSGCGGMTRWSIQLNTGGMGKKLFESMVPVDDQDVESTPASLIDDMCSQRRIWRRTHKGAVYTSTSPTWNGTRGIFPMLPTKENSQMFLNSQIVTQTSLSFSVVHCLGPFVW